MSEVNNFIAIDLGAESGRAIHGIIKEGIISLSELNRFQNRPIQIFGSLYWNIYDIYNNIINSFKLYSKNNTHLDGIGIDSWGVDYVLLDEDNNLIGLPSMYRDKKTDGIPERVFQKISQKEIYSETGIQFMNLNTLYQLYADRIKKSNTFEQAKKLLFIPDYLNFLLTKEKVNEYTISSTSQILNMNTRKWSKIILNSLNINPKIFNNVTMPGNKIGKLEKNISLETNLNSVDVILPACHDTASAVVAVPAKENKWAYLSSGTWSLIGVEIDRPIINDEAFKNNFTNEGGVFNTIRFLKNVTGLWLLQECKRIWANNGNDYSYEEISIKSSQKSEFEGYIIPDYEGFYNPIDMPKAIDEFLLKTGQPKINDPSQLTRIILESLSFKYKEVINNLNNLIGYKIEVLHIIGGGSKNDLLNQMTANALGIPVVAGPSEATAIGNIMMQAYAKGIVSNLTQIREIVRNSFDLKYYFPKDNLKWEDAYSKYCEIKNKINNLG